MFLHKINMMIKEDEKPALEKEKQSSDAWKDRSLQQGCSSYPFNKASGGWYFGDKVKRAYSYCNRAESEDKPAHKPDKAKAEKSKKDIKAIALEVIAGKWGSGEDRKNRFKAAGYNYSDVQKEVKQFLKFYPIYS